MANPLTAFTVTARSRHPQTNQGYDRKTHAYRAGYVKPSAWRLALDACSQLPTETEIDPPTPNEPGGDDKPIITKVPVFPPDVEKYEWTIERPSGFRKVFGGTRPDCDATVDVPSPGTYRITLTIRKRGGSFCAPTRRCTALVTHSSCRSASRRRQGRATPTCEASRPSWAAHSARSQR